MKTDDMLAALRRGDAAALARAISVVENRRRSWRQLIEGIYPLPGRALKIGVTGSPGSGKSTLVARLIDGFRKQQKRVGVLAVDPSSPISGGALLGDRIRMIHHSNDPHVFIRSLASRGALGGLSAAALEVADLIEASGKEIIIVETVGVGQSEIDIVNLADVVLMVLTPSSGDEIQIFKAGIIEIADIFVINKADMGGAETKAAEIGNFFAMAGREPVVAIVSAKHDQGIAELVDQIAQYQAAHAADIQAKKRSLTREFVLRSVEERARQAVLDDAASRELLDAAHAAGPLKTAEALFQRIIRSGGTDDKEN